MAEKLCRGPCGRSKSLDCFSPRAGALGGASYCRDCLARRQRERRQDPSVRAGDVAYQKARYATDPTFRAWRRARSTVTYWLYSGKIAREACATCGAKDTLLHIVTIDPIRIAWYCRTHRPCSPRRMATRPRGWWKTLPQPGADTLDTFAEKWLANHPGPGIEGSG